MTLVVASNLSFERKYC